MEPFQFDEAAELEKRKKLYEYLENAHKGNTGSKIAAGLGDAITSAYGKQGTNNLDAILGGETKLAEGKIAQGKDVDAARKAALTEYFQRKTSEDTSRRLDQGDAKAEAAERASNARLELLAKQVAESERHNRVVEGRAANKPGANLTPGETQVDKKFGEDYNDYVAQGGSSGVAENFKKLEVAKKEVKNQGGIWDRATSILPDSVGGFVNPSYKALGQDVRSNVLGLLRQTLGPQFTQKEGQTIFEQTWDPSLQGPTNEKRITSLANALKGQADAKEAAIKYFEQNGTLKGFRGALPDFDSPSATQSGSPRATPTGSKPVTATNPKTGKKIQSLDGGKTWQPL